MIDEYYTWIIFGYHSYELASQSHKPIVARCDDCCKYKKTSNNEYHSLCQSCASKYRNLSNQTRIKVLCKQCGKEYEVPKGAAHLNKYCSNQCSDEWRKESYEGSNNPNWGGGMITLVCERCGKKYNTNRADESSRFCSNDCYGQWRSENMQGEDNHMYGRYGERGGNWKGGISTEKQIFRSSTAYEIWRASVIKRDKNICQMCGTKIGAKHAHHIKPYRLYKDPDISLDVDNGITLCSESTKKLIGRKKNLNQCSMQR